MRLKKLTSLGLVSLVLAVQLPLGALADQAPADPTAAPVADQTAQTPTTTSSATDPSVSPTAPSDTTQSDSTSQLAPAPAPAPDQAPSQSVTGPTAPTGADANQYTFNPATGLWESQQYIWNPATNQTSPKTDPGYYYNPATGMWDTTTYQYHPETGTYQPVVASTAVPPSAASSSTAAGAGTTGNSLQAILSALMGGDPSIAHTGPVSTNSIGTSTTGTGFFDLFSQAVINNNLNSLAKTGDASVTGNTSAGSATTGSATVISNLFNLLSSAWSWATGGLSYFAENLFGNQTGNILLQPTVTTSGGGGQIGSLPGTIASNTNTGPNSTNTIGTNAANDLTVNAQANGNINNNLNLLAQSGNAGVTGNTIAGNATTGAAAVDLNVMNLINSAIGSGQSFFGVLNIFGSLTGNVLFPQGFLDSVAAAGTTGAPSTTASNTNTGPDSTNTISANTTNSANLTGVNTSAINNNINAAAASGSANVSNNTSAGSATTGSASTNTNTFNFGGNLTSNNAVLVLVNVLGHWIGGILTLPSTGASQAALLTGGPTTLSNTGTGSSSTNTINVGSQNNLDISSTSSGTINNNINAGAVSGNADVSGNTNAGSATSGNANVASNVANLVGANLNIKNWFGILMINVFGNWFGSVGQDTTAGALAAAAQAGPSLPIQASAAQNVTPSGAPTSMHLALATHTVVSAVNSPLAARAPTYDTSLVSAKASVAAAASHRVAVLAAAAAFLMLLAGFMLSLEQKLGRKR